MSEIIDQDLQRKVKSESLKVELWPSLRPAAPHRLQCGTVHVCTALTLAKEDKLVFNVTNDDNRFAPAALNWRTAKRSMSRQVQHRERAGVSRSSSSSSSSWAGRCLATSVNKHQQKLAYCEPTSRSAGAASDRVVAGDQ